MAEFSAVAVFVAIVLLLIQAVKDPQWYNRILVINSSGTLVAVLLSILSVLMDFHALIDIALLYVLINFISMVAILRIFSRLNLPTPPRNAGQSPGHD